MSADLKPCPFCGGDKNTICKTDYDGKDSYAVSCRYPECHGAIFTLGYGYFPTKDQAVAAWNTRAVDPAAIHEAALREAATACSIWPADEWHMHTKSGYIFAAEECQRNILAMIGEKKMTDEELIKALRDADDYNRKHYVRDPLHTDAADRIETLVNDNHRWKIECEEFWRKREETAEAKLARAVEAIKVMMDEAEYPDEVWKIGSAVLAELDAAPSR